MKRLGIVAVLSVMLAGLSGAALASHVFPDVGDGNPFHEEIGSIAAAGITTGYGDGTYRPAANVTRQAMAAFMERGYTRLYANDAVNDIATTVDTTDTGFPAIIGMEAGAASDGGGYVWLQGNGVALAGTGCPCLLVVEIVDLLDNVIAETVVGVDGFNNFSLAGAANLPADSSMLYGLGLTHVLGSPGDEVDVIADLTAIYVPFDATAENETVYPFDAPLAGLDGYSVDDFQSPSSDRMERYEDLFSGWSG